jgi:hypothetical protein
VVETAHIPHPGRRIDCVVYSSDFPWGIHLDSDIQKFKAAREKTVRTDGLAPDAAKEMIWSKYLTAMGSINGLTYLWEPVLAANAGYFDPRSNWYAQTASDDPEGIPSQAFSSLKSFDSHGRPTTAEGRRYLLSMMLGVTSGRGNSTDEVVNYLRRSVSADGTHPRGVVYFMKNDDVRSKVRHSLFPSAVKQLKSLGVDAEVIDGVLPMEKSDVQGVVVGAADFDWKASKSVILPGAICEHFTSFGGDMNTGSGQTPLSEFLRYGAAAASGTVTEPYAIPNKFPTAMVQVHYARGCNVAESFYQTVMCPYQLLVVGDPLCRPWANVPEVTVAGIEPGAKAQGMIRLTPSARFAAGDVLDHFELIVDGLRLTDCRPGGVFEIDSKRIADGFHELRVVAIAKGPLGAQGWRSLPIVADNHGHTIQVSGAPTADLGPKEPLVLTAQATGCVSICVLQGTRLLGRIVGEQGRVEINTSTLGSGPVRLQVVGLGKTGPESNVFARPLEFVVKDKS